MSTLESIRIEVVYALPEQQVLVPLTVAAGTTLLQALEASKLPERFPEIDTAKGRFGIFSKLAKPDTVLRDRDRVEIYRPLIADPKEVRKQRAAEGKVMKKGGGSGEE